MKVKLMGIEQIDYFSTKKNVQVRGVNFHCVIVDSTDRVVGNSVKAFYVGCNHPLYSQKLRIDAFYNLYFNQYGGIDTMQEIK